MGTKDNTYANTGKRLYFLSDDVDNESIGQLTWNILHQLAEDDEKVIDDIIDFIKSRT